MVFEREAGLPVLKTCYVGQTQVVQHGDDEDCTTANEPDVDVQCQLPLPRLLDVDSFHPSKPPQKVSWTPERTGFMCFELLLAA